MTEPPTAEQVVEPIERTLAQCEAEGHWVDYVETYPVRPLLNAIAAKDAEIERLRASNSELERIAREAVNGAIDAAQGEIDRLRAVAVAAKALTSECEDHGYRCEVPEHRLVALESALEAVSCARQSTPPSPRR